MGFGKKLGRSEKGFIVICPDFRRFPPAWAYVNGVGEIFIMETGGYIRNIGSIYAEEKGAYVNRE